MEQFPSILFSRAKEQNLVLTLYLFTSMKVRCGHISGRFSYPAIMEAAYGKYGYYLLSILQFMYPFLGKNVFTYKRSRGYFCLQNDHLLECTLSVWHDLLGERPFLPLNRAPNRKIHVHNPVAMVHHYTHITFPFLPLFCSSNISTAAMISYNVVVGDTLSKVLIRFVPSWNTSMAEVRFCVVFVVTVCVVIPLCLYKNVSRLARVSFISLVCVVFILFAIILKLISGDYDFVWVSCSKITTF